jgi:hypothetical protein
VRARVQLPSSVITIIIIIIINNKAYLVEMGTGPKVSGASPLSHCPLTFFIIITLIIIIILLYWRYIVTFAKVLTIYLG